MKKVLRRNTASARKDGLFERTGNIGSPIERRRNSVQRAPGGADFRNGAVLHAIREPGRHQHGAKPLREGPTLMRNTAAPIAVILVLAGTARGGGSFDGTYSGPQTTGNQGCYTLNQGVTVVVRDNKFIVHYGPPFETADVSVHVADDGTFHGYGSSVKHNVPDPISVKGRITGRQLEADIDARCSAHMMLTRAP
jgi:hypothetical protein